MPPVGSEPTTTAGDRPQTYSLDRAATVTGINNPIIYENLVPVSYKSHCDAINEISMWPKEVIPHYCQHQKVRIIKPMWKKRRIFSIKPTRACNNHLALKGWFALIKCLLYEANKGKNIAYILRHQRQIQGCSHDLTKRHECLFHAAYLLADAGYDVWMGNARGNMHSTKHDKISPMLPTFWSFRYVKTQLK